MRMYKFFWGVFLLSLSSGLAGGALSVKLFQYQNENVPVVQKNVYIEQSEMINAIEKITPSVVSIRVTKDANLLESFVVGSKDYQISGGTGFVVTENGLIITNKHVLVDDESAVYSVTFSDHSEYYADVVSRDPFDDVAVMQIRTDGEPQKFPVAKLGDSSKLKVGQNVLAVGNALAQYENSVTAGIVSAKGRDILAQDASRDAFSSLSGLIQTDAAINFGNSGGPLIDLDGKVVGMNTALVESGSNIGFAIPVDDLKPILLSVQKNGEIIRPILGVRFLMLTPLQAKELDPSLTYGALVINNGTLSGPAVISGSPAEKAGFEENDLILEVNDVKIDFDNPLNKVIRAFEPGEKITLKIWRKGEIKDLEVTLKSSKE